MLSEGLKAEVRSDWGMKPTRRVQPDPVLSPWRESELLKAQERKPTTKTIISETLVAIFLSMTSLAIKPIDIALLWMTFFYSLFRGKSSKKHTDKAVSIQTRKSLAPR